MEKTYKRQNLWKRLKPEYKKTIKQENKKYSYKMANIKEELKNTYWFTDVRYGVAFDVMTPNKLDFLGDAFNPNKGYKDYYWEKKAENFIKTGSYYE